MSTVLLIDERDCFQLVKSEEVTTRFLKTEYCIAPTPDDFDKMVETAKKADIILIHRQIWIDECEKNEECYGISQFQKLVSPRPVLIVGKQDTSHDSCPEELLYVYRQLVQAIVKFGSTIIGAKVKLIDKEEEIKTNFFLPENNSNSFLIEKLSIIGDNIIACSLKKEDGDVRKFFRLVDLQLV